MEEQKTKLSNEEFKKIINELETIVNKEFQKVEEEVISYTDFYSARKQAFEEFILRIRKYDLSDIKTELWPGLFFSNPDNCIIDLSETNAHFDFSKINDSDSNWISLNNFNLSGCKIDNLDKLTGRLNYEAFDDETRKKYPKIFLDDSYNEEFRKRYCSNQITVDDYFSIEKEKRDSLNLRDKLSFDEGYISIINDDDKIENFIRINDEYKKILELVNKHLYPLKRNSIALDDDKRKAELFLKNLKSSNYTEWKDIIYKYTRRDLLHYFGKYNNIDKYPQSFIEENRDIFLLDQDISEELKNKYFNGKLKLEDFLGKTDFLKVNINYGVIDEKYEIRELIVNYKEELSHVPVEKADLIRTIAFDIVKLRNRHYNSLEQYLKQDNFDLYIKYKEDKKENELSFEERLKNSLQNNNGFSSVYRKAIKQFGIENILEFERKTGLLSKEKDGVKSYYFIKLMTDFSDFNNIKKIEELYVKNIIRNYSHKENGDDYKNLDYINSGYFKTITLDSNELDGLNEEEKNDLINKFYKGELNYTDIRKYPILMEVLKNKDLSFVLRRNIYNCYSEYGSYKTNDYDIDKKIKLNSKILELWKIYGKVFDILLYNEINLEDNTKEEIERFINKKLYEYMIDINHPSNYDNCIEDCDLLNLKSFKEQYPCFYIDEENFTEEELEKDYTPEELANNTDLIKRMKKTSIAFFTSEEYYWITDMFKEKETDDTAYEANLNRLIVMLEFSKIKDDPVIANEFKNYYLSHNNINNIREISEVLQRLRYTNSSVLFSLRESLLEQLLATKNPTDSFNKIEKVFIKNNIPLYAKMYYCFRILYPDIDKKFDFTENSRVATELKDGNVEKNRFIGLESPNEKRFMLIYNDLLQIAIKSNSIDMQQYLSNIENGSNIFNKLSEGKTTYEELSQEEKQEIDIFAKHLETIYDNSRLTKDLNIDLDTLSTKELINVLKDKISPTERYDLKDRIVRMYGYSAGYKSFNQLKSAMEDSVSNANLRGNKYAELLSNNKFSLEEGDLIRCIGDYQALGGSLDNGNVSKEYLSTIREKSTSDTTPLDIDWSLMEENNSIYNAIVGSPTGFGFGNVYLVIKKDNQNFNITRDSKGNELDTKYDPNKQELFGTQVNDVGWKTHWGIRTGIALTDVDYILYKKTAMIDNEKPYDEAGNVNYEGDTRDEYDDLRAIKFEIARHGYYIPVVDFSGNLIFTPKEYEELKSQMNGLSYYGDTIYNFSNNLVTPEIEEIRNSLYVSKNDTQNKSKEVNLLLKQILDKYNLSLKNKIDGNLTPGSVEVIDTGSTGRTTNEPGDGDFDLLLRLDNKFISDKKNYNKFKEDILSLIKEHNPEDIMITDNGDFRFKKVQLDSGNIVDIDLTFDRKTDKVKYTTEVCIKDRLETIRKQDSEKYEYVVANIILAKRVLKEAHAYKSANSKEADGGLGGVGVENWILQHGGSFYDAATSFLEKAKNKSFDEFKKIYTIWDFGENHLAERKGHYSHDNFVNDNMNEKGYEKMTQALELYLEKQKMYNDETVKNY